MRIFSDKNYKFDQDSEHFINTWVRNLPIKTHRLYTNNCILSNCDFEMLCDISNSGELQIKECVKEDGHMNISCRNNKVSIYDSNIVSLKLSLCSNVFVSNCTFGSLSIHTPKFNRKVTLSNSTTSGWFSIHGSSFLLSIRNCDFRETYLESYFVNNEVLLNRLLMIRENSDSLTLDGTLIEDMTIKDINFEKCIFEGVVFTGCNIYGCDFSGVTINETNRFVPVRFKNCDVDNGTNNFGNFIIKRNTPDDGILYLYSEPLTHDQIL